MLKRLDKHNGIIEVTNLLAGSPIQSTSMPQVADILKRYDLGFSEVRSQFIDIVRAVLTHVAEDGELSVADHANLAHLQMIFELPDEDMQRVREQVLADLYAKSVADALSDGHISLEGRRRLNAMTASLSLPEARTKEIYGGQVARLLQLTLEQMMEDRRFTVDEEKRLAEMAANYSVDLTLGEKTQALLERFKLLARIEAGQLPGVEPPIRLQRGERCHASFACAQSEIRQQTKSYRYSGPTASIKIMKGVRWRVGQVSVQRMTRDVMTQLDSGTLYVTNRRLLFDGGKKNTSIALNKIVHFTIFSDGLRVEKDTGRDQYFTGDGDLELIGAILERLITESR